MGATDAPAGATIDSWIVNGTDSAGQTVSKVATAAADGGFSVVVPLVGPNVWGRTWQFVAIPRVRSQAGQIKEGGQSPASDAVQPKGPPGNPDVQVVTQQGVTPTTVTLKFVITPGDGNGNPPAPMTFTYSSPWGDGGADAGNQFDLTIPMTATGTVTVRQTAADGSYSTGTMVVQPTLSVDTASSVLTIRYVPEKPLFCQALVGGVVVLDGKATDTPDGSPSYYTYQYSYVDAPAGDVTLQCGGDNSAPTTYQINTTH
jgi:hypothetical protein